MDWFLYDRGLRHERAKGIIRQVNDLLRHECKRNNFQFISNDNITREVLWRDGLH